MICVHRVARSTEKKPHYGESHARMQPGRSAAQLGEQAVIRHYRDLSSDSLSGSLWLRDGFSTVRRPYTAGRFYMGSANSLRKTRECAGNLRGRAASMGVRERQRRDHRCARGNEPASRSLDSASAGSL